MLDARTIRTQIMFVLDSDIEYNEDILEIIAVKFCSGLISHSSRYATTIGPTITDDGYHKGGSIDDKCNSFRNQLSS